MLDVDLNSIALHLSEYKLEIVQKPKHTKILKSLFDALDIGNVCLFIYVYLYIEVIFVYLCVRKYVLKKN